MSWVTVIWSMSASACLTLAMIHGFIWFRQRAGWANLAFMAAAIGTAAFAGYELALMLSPTAADYARQMRLAHVAVFVIVVSLAAFVRLYCRAGRLWLMWSVCALRAVSLVLNFSKGASLNYTQITDLRHVSLFGEVVATPVGTPNPWMIVGILSLLLLFIYVADAAATVWKRGDRRLAVSVGGSVVFFIVAGTGQAQLIFWAGMQWPITSSLFYLGTVVAMSYELGNEALNAARLARELSESERRMALAVEATNLGIWVRDLIGPSVWASDRWRALFGFADAEPITFEAFVGRIHPDDRDATRASLADGVRTGSYEVEYRVAMPDGGTRWMASRGRATFDADGEPTRVWEVSQDVTQRKLAESEQLAQQARTAHLLRVASLGELSAAMTHELNQPLMAIMSNAQAAQRFLSRDDPDLGEIREILQDIVADDERASAVIRRLRPLVRRGDPDPRPFAVEVLVEDVLKLMRGDLTAHGVLVVSELEAGLPQACCDVVQIQQVLINLILNARDAMASTPPAGRKLTVRATRVAKAVQVSVTDSGGGIPGGDEEKIFEPYHTTKSDGLGLGLSLSRSIIIAHGGKLWAERLPGGGSAFSFTIPEADGGLR